MLIDETEYGAISEAIVRFHTHLLLNRQKEEMEAIYGADIAAKVEMLSDEAMGCPVDWKTATMDSALDTMHAFLNAHYPWLSPEAKSQLNYCFIMCWK